MMEQDFLAASVASIFACAVTTTGILAIRRYREWTQRNTIYSIYFAAGVLISVSFLHIVPTAIAMKVEAPTYLLAGYLAMLGFDRSLTAYVCDKPMSSDYALGLLPLAGIGFHSYLDGVIYAISFSIGTFTGLLLRLELYSMSSRRALSRMPSCYAAASQNACHSYWLLPPQP